MYSGFNFQRENKSTFSAINHAKSKQSILGYTFIYDSSLFKVDDSI